MTVGVTKHRYFIQQQKVFLEQNSKWLIFDVSFKLR